MIQKEKKHTVPLVYGLQTSLEHWWDDDRRKTKVFGEKPIPASHGPQLISQ